MQVIYYIEILPKRVLQPAFSTVEGSSAEDKICFEGVASCECYDHRVHAFVKPNELCQLSGN